MPSSAALLSANASLSAILGGTAGTGTGGITPASGPTQGTDFGSLLSPQTGLASARGGASPQPRGAAATANAAIDIDETASSGNDQLPAASGKTLPLAALASAALPVPVTLSSLAAPSDGTSDGASDGADDSEQTPAPSIDTGTTDARALALMAMIQTARPVQTAQPSASSMIACANLTTSAASPEPAFSTLSTAQVPAAAGMDSASARTAAILPNPGFTLFPPETGTDTGNPSGATSIATTNATTNAASQTTQPQLALAIAAPQPGFTLLTDTVPVAGATSSTSDPMPQLALSDPAATGASPVSPSVADALASDALSSQAKPAIRLASAQDGASQGKFAAVSARKTTANAASLTPASASMTSTARPGIDLDGDDAQPGFSTHSPTSASADGVSALDNAPSLPQPPASAGTADAAQTLAATGGAATSLSPPQSGSDMAALVDRLVEARAAARSGLTSPVVQASLNHADFGRVSLRFNTDDGGLSVSMASSDPGFAPAAQAALAQAPAVSANGQSHGAGQQDSSHHGSGQSGLNWAQSSTQPALQANTGGQSGMGGSSGQGGQGWAQGGNTNAPAGQNAAAAQARAAAASTSATASPRNRGGILA